MRFRDEIRSMVILDHTQDTTGTETHRLLSLYPAPEFVKTAAFERLHGDPQYLPASAYGDEAKKIWPIHSSPATWLSSLFFFHKQAELDSETAATVEGRIMKSAKFFGILPQVEELRTKIAQASEHDLSRVPDSDFALVWVSDEGQKERHYPLRNPDEVKAAADWFGDYRDQFVWADRQTIASKLVEKAAAYNLSLPNATLLECTAGHGVCPHSEMVEMLQTRANLCRRTHEDLSLDMQKLAATVNDYGVDWDDHAAICKLAGVVDAYDRETELTKLYDTGGLERPEEVLFKLTAKMASDCADNHVALLSGAVYEKSAFDPLPLSHVKKWLGDEFAEAISAGGLYVDTTKVAAIAPTLPRGDAEMFERMAAAGGVLPVMRDKVASDGPTMEELQTLAASYVPGEKSLDL
jgi:hypothetical protein